MYEMVCGNREKVINVGPNRVKNKAKAISAEFLELNFKNKLEETGKQDETGKNRKTGRKNTENRKKLNDTERNRKKQEETGRKSKKLFF